MQEAAQRREKQLLLPKIPTSRNWKLSISHPDFCLKVFSTVARCCWVLRLGFSSPAPFTTRSEQWLCWELSSRVLYLTSVLSKSSLSTAEKFGAGFTQFLGSWVISAPSTAHPGKDCGGNRQTLLRTSAHFTEVITVWSSSLQTVMWDLGFKIWKETEPAVVLGRAIYQCNMFLN
jgi:hypothetical protein